MSRPLHEMEAMFHLPNPETCETSLLKFLEAPDQQGPLLEEHWLFRVCLTIMSHRTTAEAFLMNEEVIVHRIWGWSDSGRDHARMLTREEYWDAIRRRESALDG